MTNDTLNTVGAEGPDGSGPQARCKHEQAQAALDRDRFLKLIARLIAQQVSAEVKIVLVTPALLERLKAESIADKELSALLAREQLVPIVHGTTYEELREVSPLLASRSGLSTAENPMADVAIKLAELVAI